MENVLPIVFDVWHNIPIPITGVHPGQFCQDVLLTRIIAYYTTHCFDLPFLSLVSLNQLKLANYLFNGVYH